MNKAYIDLLESEAGAVLLYVPDNYTPMTNFLESKFPYNVRQGTQVWAGGSSNLGGDIVIWFTEEGCIYTTI